jgi:hypothetical protein
VPSVVAGLPRDSKLALKHQATALAQTLKLI